MGVVVCGEGVAGDDGGGRDDEERAGESCGGFENEGGVEKDL